MPCVLLPRMELRFGRHAWAVNAALWFCFHLTSIVGYFVCSSVLVRALDG
jgi:hypothetical protein